MGLSDEIQKQEREIERQKAALLDLEQAAKSFQVAAEERLRQMQQEIMESRGNLERQIGALLILRQIQEQGGDANGGEAEVVGKAGT